MSLIALAGASFHLIFGRFLWVQTDRVRCVFEKDSFEFYNLKDGKLTQKRSNYVADTRNRWKYDSIINYGFFPSEDFPVICYFKGNSKRSSLILADTEQTLTIRISYRDRNTRVEMGQVVCGL